MANIVKMGITCAKAPIKKARSRKKTFHVPQQNSPSHTPISSPRSLPGGYLQKENILKTLGKSNGLNGFLNNNSCTSNLETTTDKSSTFYIDCHPEIELYSEPTLSSVKMWFLKRGTTFKKKIGHGSYATVYMADNKNTNGLVAVKVIDLKGRKNNYTESRRLDIEREIEIMCCLRHQHLIQVLQRPVKLYGRYLCMVMELATQDLFDYVQKQGPLPEDECRQMFRQLLSALSYCHSQGIAHRDLKCENILLNDQNLIKLSDFGMAKHCYNEVEDKPELCKTYCGSNTYIAPEVLKRRSYDAFKADMWSVGVILFIMLSKSMPFDDHVPQRLISQQINRDWELPHEISKKTSKSGLDLLDMLLEPDIDQRPDVQQVLRHPWLN